MLAEDYDPQILTTLDDIVNNLEVEPQLKAIIYECLHAQDKVSEKEAADYEDEINSVIMREKALREQQEKILAGEHEDFQELLDFKAELKKQDQEDELAPPQRTKKRKPDNPQPNRRDYQAENKDHGVATEVDLVLKRIAGLKPYGDDDFRKAEGKFERDLFKYSQEVRETKQARTQRFLTVQSLLDHPYFLEINTADISSVIDQYEELLQGKGHMPNPYD